MLKRVLRYYKTQLFLSLTLGIVLIAVKLFISPLIIAMTLLGAFLGTFILDLDYIFFAYLVEPEASFSKTLKGFLLHKDYGGALDHIHLNKEEVHERTLNSAIFQMILAGITLFAISATPSVFVKALLLSTMANSLYKLSDYYFDGKTNEWFWALKNPPTKNGVLLYALVLLAVLAYSISLF